MSEKTKIKKKQIGNKKTFGQYFRAHWQLYGDRFKFCVNIKN